MAEFKKQVLDILEEVCENDIVKENLMFNYLKKVFLILSL